MSSKQPGSPPLRFGKSASYDLSFSGSKTSSKRLEYYLNVASDFGLARQGATVQNLLPLLPPTSPGADDFGALRRTIKCDTLAMHCNGCSVRRLMKPRFGRLREKSFWRTMSVTPALRTLGGATGRKVSTTIGRMVRQLLLTTRNYRLLPSRNLHSPRLQRPSLSLTSL